MINTDCGCIYFADIPEYQIEETIRLKKKKIWRRSDIRMKHIYHKKERNLHEKVLGGEVWFSVVWWRIPKGSHDPIEEKHDITGSMRSLWNSPPHTKDGSMKIEDEQISSWNI